MTLNGETNVALTRKSWGAAAPEWVLVLAEAADASSQADVSRKLGVSSAQINQALHNTYAGRIDRLESRVRGELMNEKVACPVLGEITKRRCLDEQRRNNGTPQNAVRVELRRACRKCPNRSGAKEAA